MNLRPLARLWPIVILAPAFLTCTEQVLVERTLYDTVYLEKPVQVSFTGRDTVTVYQIQRDTVYVSETEYLIDTVYVPVVDTLEYSNTITVPWFWKKHVDNFLAAVEECKFPLFARDVVIDTTFYEPASIWGGDTFIYAYSYMKGGTTPYNGYWYINIDIRKKDCAEAIIYRELFHRLAGFPYAGDWRLWNHFIGDTNIIGYDSEKDQIMYQNWPGCLEDMDPYYRARYASDLLACLK